ncbi:MAG: Serine/threonine protein phosphatase [uncultured Sulfurovum sp.]|uniref:Serine/threonine protein phosphatase n=1 Tax=uncultured Sulfurovum sp. TaxID=269237 RepID=A0A6S6TVC0_9BACT|nr:MAG: Serine/threonine protein phosphatase [uncultured Sulfurovum sp.]
MHHKSELENIYVIGDVHGCFHTLQNLVAQLPQDAELIFVGDLCDKGNFSKDVIDFVIENDYKCIKGNHEHLMETYLEDAIFHDNHSPWSSDKRYGGMVTLQSYGRAHETMLKHVEWIKSLPMYIQIDKYFITHGFALPFYEHRNNPAYYNDYLLNRYEEGMEVFNEEVINIFGHCVFEEVVSGENFYGIDTGCSYGKKLTALQLGTMEVYQEAMDSRDSDYSIKELKLDHISLPDDKHTITHLRMHIDALFTDFDLVSTEVAEYIVERFGEVGKKEIENMLEKKQLFIKQAKRVLTKY